ncbi:MAG: hypothetical protein HOW97_33535 [Catenulispora sp.]|nr:hypothetical protein [Catenulispora sp.]
MAETGVYGPTVGDSGLVRRHALVTLIRDISVFLPILYTWWSLSDVLPHYHSVDVNDSLLGDWIAGKFPKNAARNPKEFAEVISLSTTALVVVGLVFGIIILTAWAHRMATAIDRAAGRGANRSVLGRGASASDREFERRLLEAVERSVERGVASAGSMLNTSVEKVQESVAATMSSGPIAQLPTALEEWRTAANALTTASETLAIPAQALAEFMTAQTTVVEVQRKLTEELRALIVQMQDATRAAMEEATLQRGIAGDTVGHLRQATDMVGMFVQKSETLDRALVNLGQATDALASSAARQGGGERSNGGRSGRNSGGGRGRGGGGVGGNGSGDGGGGGGGGENGFRARTPRQRDGYAFPEDDE